MLILKLCKNCKYYKCALDEPPCIYCEDYNHWEKCNNPDTVTVMFKVAGDDGEFKELGKAVEINESISPEDVVNHPSHYETGKYECFDVMREIYGDQAVKNFCLLNAFKYLYRCKRKNGVEDIKKAQWYLDRLVVLNDADESN